MNIKAAHSNSSTIFFSQLAWLSQTIQMRHIFDWRLVCCVWSNANNNNIRFVLCFAFRRGKIAKRYNCCTRKIRKLFANVRSSYATHHAISIHTQSMGKMHENCMQCHQHYFASRCCIMCLVCAFEIFESTAPMATSHFHSFHISRWNWNHFFSTGTFRIVSSFPIHARLFYVLWDRTVVRCCFSVLAFFVCFIF